MIEEKRKNTETGKGGRRFSRLSLILVGMVVVTIVCCFIWQKCLWNVGSIDEQLAAIDAELAIPDAENAAVYYTRLLTDPNNTSALDDLSSYTPSAYIEPWDGSEHPELAALLKTHSTFIQTLLDISEMQEARFPIYPDPSSISFTLADMRRVTFILSWAVANDLAEGRIDAAYSKYRCQLKFARQIYQQPATLYRYVGMAIESVALGNIRRAVMRDDITSEQLRSLEMILETPKNLNEVDAEIAAKVNRLIPNKQLSQMSISWRLRRLWFGHEELKEQERKQRLLHLRRDATRRATPILIALRRHKEKTGAWPETLEQIEPKLPEQMLIDPQNNGPFVYKRDGDEFVFYSKGPNGIDEDGIASKPADDYPMWPLKIKKIPAGEQ